MSDIEDLVVKAIQSYAESIYPAFEESHLCIMALADQIAPHIIKELGLEQEWAIATAFTYPHWGASGEPLEPREEVDTMTHESADRQGVVAELHFQNDYDKSLGYKIENGRRYLASRLYTEWTEDEATPEVDQELVALVADDL
jgi:hypothetical protein